MEHWMCLDCYQVGPLNRRGQCGTCGSDAVTEPEGRKVCTNAQIADKTVLVTAKTPGMTKPAKIVCMTVTRKI
jgi:hypothetical protein